MTVTLMLLACLHAEPAADPGPSLPPSVPEVGPSAVVENEPPAEPPAVSSPPATVEPEVSPPEPARTEPQPQPEPEPSVSAMDHLARAQALKAAGSLGPAEAEASVAISLLPDDPAAYLERAQIRMQMADAATGEDAPARRARAMLLRQAAADVGAYIERAQLSVDSVTFFEARQHALLRDADALDPPPEPEPEPAAVVPEPAPQPVIEPPSDPVDRDHDHRRRSRALWGTGIGLGVGGAVLAGYAFRIEQRGCESAGDCSARWRANAPYLGPAVALSALGSTSIVLGLLDSPGLDDPRIAKTTRTTTLSLGATATALGAVTGAIAGARMFRLTEPSDDRALMTTQALANTSATSLAVALPLLSAGVTAWLSSRRSQGSTPLARALVRRR